MDAETFVQHLKNYERELTAIEGRFRRTRDAIHIGEGDDSRFKQIVQEVVDLLSDVVPKERYARQVYSSFHDGISNYVRSPSIASVRDIITLLKSVITRVERNPNLLDTPLATAHSGTRDRRKVFIIHGRNEAKRRELKDIIASRFGLDPIILDEHPLGARTVIEKFEVYASQCSFAIALFTPDDQVTINGEQYVQARPNVVYELGWFCATLTRDRVILLLQEGTEIFSDFGGVVQIRFREMVSERLGMIEAELKAAKVIP